MPNKITLTDEQMKALKNGQSITIEPPKNKWKPKLGTFRMNVSVSIGDKNETIKAVKKLNSYTKQLMWLNENYDGWVADWTNIHQEKYYIEYNVAYGIYESRENRWYKSLSGVYMSKQNANNLCELLNNKIVEF